MTTLRELCNDHVWEALEGLYNGLIKQSKRKDFEINMAIFGDSCNEVCYGCAATCTIQELTHKNLLSTEIVERDSRAKFLKLDYVDLGNFERAIDGFRTGYAGELFNYFNKNEFYSYKYDLYKRMTNNNWESLLPELKEITNKLKEKGI